MNAGCRIVARGVSASTSLGVGRRKSSLGSEQFLDFAKKAACCVEARKEVREGERQSPEADKMFQNGFGVTKYVIITFLSQESCEMEQCDSTRKFRLFLLAYRIIRIKDQGLGIRTEAQRVKGSGSTITIIIVEGQDLGSLLSKAICSISRSTYKALQQHLL